MKLLINSTPVALWQKIVQDAEVKCGTPLMEDIESYVVFLLMRYLRRPDFVKNVMAVEYLQGLALKTHQRLQALQEVGDKCLLFSGLFPHLATKRLVKISYLVHIGQSAYAEVGDRLFELLANQFVTLMDILQTVQIHTSLSPIEAYDLWNETGSQQALEKLRKYTQNQSCPIILPKLF